MAAKVTHIELQELEPAPPTHSIPKKQVCQLVDLHAHHRPCLNTTTHLFLVAIGPM